MVDLLFAVIFLLWIISGLGGSVISYRAALVKICGIAATYWLWTIIS